jgi:uncharacterized protein involved in exopolysaccharide biosynthesis
MDFFESVRILVRRWALVVPGVLLVALVGGGTAIAIGPQYQAVGSLVLIAPVPPGVGSTVDANPYLLFTGSLNVTASMLARITLKDDATIERLRAAGATAQYEVAASSSASPILTVTATGKTREEAIRTVAAVSEGIEQELRLVQQESQASTETWIKAQPLTAPEGATLVLTRPLRSVGLAVAFGLAAVVVLAFLIEGYEKKRLAATGSASLGRGRGPERIGANAST